MIFKKIVRIFLKHNLKKSFKNGRMRSVLESLEKCLSEKDTKQAIIKYVETLQILEKCSWEFQSFKQLELYTKRRLHKAVLDIETAYSDLKNNNRIVFIGQPIFIGGQNIEKGTFIVTSFFQRNSPEDVEHIQQIEPIEKIDEISNRQRKMGIEESWKLTRESIKRFYEKLKVVDEILNPTLLPQIKGMEAYDPLPLR